jgi:carbon starvation protein CstA
MLAEHIIYSTALAILVGMVFYKYTGRDSSWIIILCAWIPDIDLIANSVLTRSGFTLLFEGHRITHGVFHNIAIMVFFGILLAFLLHPFGIRFLDAFFFAVIGFGAHLFEDALVYDPGYEFLWPLSSKVLGLGLLPNMINEENYMRNFFGIANTEVLIIGLVLLLVAILIRTYWEGSSWIRWYMPDKVYVTVFGKFIPLDRKFP